MSRYIDVRLNTFDIRRLSVRAATRTVEKVVRETEALAKLAARGPYSTGRLAASIHSSVSVHGRTVVGEVRSSDRRADMIHDGTVPHVIRPRRPGGMLRFYWRKVGHTVTLPKVNHPGMEGKRFLAEPMERVGRRNRFIVITYN